ncbi:MAG: hypothetical protein WCK42_09660, partial [Myxococcaceae bacterium]
VEESAIAHAQLYLLEQSKIVSEAAGAISLAALLENQISHIQGKTVCVVVSGGNIDVKLEIAESGQRARSVLTLREVLG